MATPEAAGSPQASSAPAAAGPPCSEPAPSPSTPRCSCAPRTLVSQQRLETRSPPDRPRLAIFCPSPPPPPPRASTPAPRARLPPCRAALGCRRRHSRWCGQGTSPSRRAPQRPTTTPARRTRGSTTETPGYEGQNEGSCHCRVSRWLVPGRTQQQVAVQVVGEVICIRTCQSLGGDPPCAAMNAKSASLGPAQKWGGVDVHFAFGCHLRRRWVSTMATSCPPQQRRCRRTVRLPRRRPHHDALLQDAPRHVPVALLETLWRATGLHKNQSQREKRHDSQARARAALSAAPPPCSMSPSAP